ncbi:MAG: hypothetical protein PVS3B3_33090 [Ktedonobacteraceae bacterium]
MSRILPNRWLLSVVLIFLAGCGTYIATESHGNGLPVTHSVTVTYPSMPTYAPTAPRPAFLASIDTMKVSRDTVHRQFSVEQIQDVVRVMAQLHSNYIAIDTNWDYPKYMEQWVTAVHAMGQHVWFRGHPDQWESNGNATNIMTPSAYLGAERSFILNHTSFFLPGDIFDACSEPEQGKYWSSTYQEHWAYNAPNDATRAFNDFIRKGSDVADDAFHQVAIYGVITNVRSTNTFFATHPGDLEMATVKKFGSITIDSYPEQNATDAWTATHARITELDAIEKIWHLPIIIGEIGYSNNINVDDATQLKVLQAEFAAIAILPYIAGMNYWVGPGSTTSGGYTYLIVNNDGTWILRPAAYALIAFYKSRGV